MKFLVPILVAISIMTSVSSVTLPQASGSMLGKWSFYGTLSPKTDYRAKDFDRIIDQALEFKIEKRHFPTLYSFDIFDVGISDHSAFLI